MSKKKEKSQGKGSGNCKVMSCVCENEFQDLHYGKGRRLHNPTEKLVASASGATKKYYRCTVCGALNA